MANTQNSSNDSVIRLNGTLVTGPQVVTSIPGVAGGHAAYVFYLRIVGPGSVDQRFVYALSHEGFGGAGLIVLYATLRNLDGNPNYQFNSVTVNSSGQVVINVTITSGTFQYFIGMSPLGYDVYLPTG
jgi:hypothetical protein